MTNHVGDVARATNLPPNVAAGIIPGEIYVDRAFMSTAIDRTSFKGLFLFFIQSRTGKYLEPFSRYSSQREVLYPPGKKFIIVSVREGKDGLIEVELKEK